MVIVFFCVMVHRYIIPVEVIRHFLEDYRRHNTVSAALCFSFTFFWIIATTDYQIELWHARACDSIASLVACPHAPLWCASCARGDSRSACVCKASSSRWVKADKASRGFTHAYQVYSPELAPLPQRLGSAKSPHLAGPNSLSSPPSLRVCRT